MQKLSEKEATGCRWPHTHVQEARASALEAGHARLGGNLAAEDREKADKAKTQPGR